MNMYSLKSIMKYVIKSIGKIILTRVLFYYESTLIFAFGLHA